MREDVPRLPPPLRLRLTVEPDVLLAVALRAHPAVNPVLLRLFFSLQRFERTAKVAWPQDDALAVCERHEDG